MCHILGVGDVPYFRGGGVPYLGVGDVPYFRGG